MLFEIKEIVPFGVDTGQPVRFDRMFHPAGSNLTMAEAKRSQPERVIATTPERASAGAGS